MSWLEMMQEEEGAGSAASPVKLVELLFDSDFTDTGSLGLTWSNPDGTVSVTSGYLLRTVEASTRGLVASAYPFDFTKDFTVVFRVSNMNFGGTRAVLCSTQGTTTLYGLRIQSDATGNFSISTDGVTSTLIGEAPAPGIEAPTNPTIHTFSITFHATERKLILHYNGTYIQSRIDIGVFTTPPTQFDIFGDAGTTQFAPAGRMHDFIVWDQALYTESDY